VLQLVQSLRSGDVEVVEVPDPRPRGNEVLVRTAWSVISPGTESAIARTASRSLIGKAMDRPDQVRKVMDKVVRDGVGATAAAVKARLDDLLTPGYSSAGVVELVGPEAKGFAVGDVIGCVGANVACHAELAVVPAPMCFHLPDGLDPRHAAFGALGAIAGHGVRIAEVGAGETVAVIGLGLVGQLAAQLATAAGARVIGIDVSPERVELARSLGAVAGAGLAEAEEIVRAVSGGHGADGVIVAAASDDSAPVVLAAALARDRAVVSVVGDVGLDIPRRPFFEKELALRVSRSYGPGRYDPGYEEEGHDYPIGFVRWTERRLIAYFYEEVAAGRVQLEPLITHEFELAEGTQAYTALEAPGRLAILLRYPEAPQRRVPPAPQRAPAGPGGGSRVALIGPGLFAGSTLLPLLESSDARVVAVAGGSGPRALATARRVDGARVVTPEEAIAADDVDVVVIATRHDSHAALAGAALEAGKAVFLEKPLAIDEPGLDRLRPLLEAGGRLVVDFNRRFAPATRAALARFAGRREPLHVGMRVNAGPLPAEHWLRDPAVGGGRLVGEGCHFVDLCRALVGSPVASLAAVGLPEDGFQLTLRHADDSVSTIAYVSTGTPRMPKERIEVIGAGRAVAIEDFRRVRTYSGRPLLRRPAVAQDKGHAATLDAALSFFAGGGAPPIPYDELVETTLVTLRAREALRLGDEAPQSL
jgi:predicted dehydrogenase